MPEKFRSFVRKLTVLPIRLYQATLSKILPRSCIYEPSCSAYAAESIARFGFFRGVVLGATRVFRCNSAFFTGGGDPVPRRFSFRQIGYAYRKFSLRKRKK